MNGTTLLIAHRWSKYLIVIGLLLWLIVNIATLTSYPIPTCDEAFYTRTAQNYAQNQPWPELSGTFFYLPYGRAYWAILGTFQRLSADTLFWGRLASYLGVLLTAAAAHGLTRHVTGRKNLARWVAVLIAFSWLGFFIGHRVRPNVFATAMAVLLIWALLLALQHMSKRSAALFGLALLGPLLFHSVGVYVSFAAGFWFLIVQLKRQACLNLTVAISSAVLLALLIAWVRLAGSLPFVVSTALADPIEFVAGYVSASGAQTSMISPVMWFAEFWWNYYFWFATPLSPVQGIFFMFGLGYHLLRPSSKLNSMAWIVVISTIPFAVINADFTAPPEYGFLWLPLYMILGVTALTDWFEQHQPHRTQLRLTLLTTLLILYIGGDAYLLVRERVDTYKQANQEIRQHVDADASILAASFWWYRLNQHTHFIDETVLAPVGSILWWNAVPAAAAQQPQPNVSILDLSDSELARHAQQTLMHLQPDYILDDGRIGCATDASPISLAVTDYAQTFCQPVARLDQLVSNDIERYYGEQIIYDCRPDADLGTE